ncbi:MAG: lipocalin-like domain-containing protein [Hyphomicrobiaceae bacterium]|nr:lipocalin-like domain-containing protein [Hyphomicrobiaceae bacterium]
MSSSIVGTWRLVKGNATFEDGTSAPPPYGGEKGMGRVTFDPDGRMMAVLCDGRRQLPSGMVREYSSYCGNYTFDGERLLTQVDATSDPGRLGGDQVREVAFEGHYMVFRHTVTRADGRRLRREMSWEKISDV